MAEKTLKYDDLDVSAGISHSNNSIENLKNVLNISNEFKSSLEELVSFFNQSVYDGDEEDTAEIDLNSITPQEFEKMTECVCDQYDYHYTNIPVDLTLLGDLPNLMKKMSNACKEADSKKVIFKHQGGALDITYDIEQMEETIKKLEQSINRMNQALELGNEFLDFMKDVSNEEMNGTVTMTISELGELKLKRIINEFDQGGFFVDGIENETYHIMEFVKKGKRVLEDYNEARFDYEIEDEVELVSLMD